MELVGGSRAAEAPASLTSGRNNASRPKKSQMVCRWLAVRLPDDEAPSVVTCESFEELAATVRDMAVLDGFVFAFYGLPVHITAGDAKWLVHPVDGTALPLFATERSTEMVADGFMGRSAQYEIDPNALPADPLVSGEDGEPDVGQEPDGYSDADFADS